MDSITGGYAYRGKRFPALYGAYVYSDFVTGRIVASFPRGEGREQKFLTRTHEANEWDESFVAQGEHITSFGENRDGELYILTYAGRIYRFE